MKYSFYKCSTLKPYSTGSFYVVLTIMLALFSCNKEDSKPSFSVSGGEMELAIAPGEQTESYSIHTNSSWEIVPVKPTEWVTVSPMKGDGNADFTVKISENKTTEVRVAKFAFRVNGRFQSDLLSIEQEGAEGADDGDGDAPLYLELEGISDNTLDIDSGAFEEAYFVRSNGAWSINWDETVDWMSVSPTEGIGDASVTIAVDSNATPEVRTVDLNFVRGDGEVTTVQLAQGKSGE